MEGCKLRIKVAPITCLEVIWKAVKIKKMKKLPYFAILLAAAALSAAPALAACTKFVQVTKPHPSRCYISDYQNGVPVWLCFCDSP